jgi:phosphoglycolate phosphatase-like HAD superfamily hydrolase
MKPTLYLDFDGTIVDPSERLYRLYSDALRQLGWPPLSKRRYWALTRRRQPERAIVERTAPVGAAAKYLASRSDRLESPELLRHDAVLPGVAAALAELTPAYRLVLVSFRRHEAALRDQVAALGLAPRFAAVVACHQSDLPGWRAKAAAIQADPGFDPVRAAVAGDTEDDISAGQALGVPTVAVLSGLRTPAFLTALQPTVVLPSLARLPAWLAGSGPSPGWFSH